MAPFLLLIMIVTLSEIKSQSCGPRISARLLMDIPCDMNKSNYCTHPGSAYPWQAVRKYIYDNQGLMRRMYGDEVHSIVLRNEISARREKYDVSWSARSGFERSVTNLRPRARPSSVSKTLTSSNTKETTAGNLNVTSESSPGDLDVETSTAVPSIATETTSFASRTDTAFTEEAVSVDDVTEDKLSNTIHTDDVDETAEKNTENVEEEYFERGVNACPVKEEVVAPYWANNTRGETLALLNVYPFQQYVIWESCAFAGEQMLCRKGCKCEQQYRLHRLLAFDPKNECRGVFSDWFRFPSCCVCICYSISRDSEEE
ncbi:protein spaetzle 4-like isoform X1 [Centruroides vittatus]|uniref:protein spaetzle 4-like isoform X1 n=2 Tax=Centruroides vittatus TaxID=120091 RepID=UPI00350EF4DA